jgi:hypothetical protein
MYEPVKNNENRDGEGGCDSPPVYFAPWYSLRRFYEETVGGVKIPIPGGMTKSQDSGIECRYRASAARVLSGK